MEKKLISEISRINEMMGVKTPSLIFESVACPWCRVATESIQRLQNLMIKGGIDSRTYNLKLNDLLTKAKDAGLTAQQKQTIDILISNFNQITKSADDIAKQTENAKKAISDLSSSLSKIPDDAAQYTFDFVKLYEMKGFVDDFFRNNPWPKKNLKMVEDVFSDPSKKDVRINMYDSFDEYFDDSYKPLLEKKLNEKGYPESSIPKIVEKYRELLKGSPIVGGAWPSKELDDVGPVRKGDYGDEMLSDVDPIIYNLYSEIIKKNGDQLTQIERDLLDDVKLWTEGKNVSFEKYKPKQTTNGGGTDGGNIPTNKTSENFFEKYGDDMDFELMSAMNELSEKSDATKDPNLEKIISYLKKNKKLTEKELQTLESGFELLDEKYAKRLKEELKNPSGKKLSFLKSFVRTKIVPLFQAWFEALEPARLFAIAKKNKYNGMTFDFASDRFKKKLENILLKTNSDTVNSPATKGELQSLKDSFLRLMSPKKEMKLTYDNLWADLEKYMENKLDPKSKEKWYELVLQIKKEKPNSWSWMTFWEIIPKMQRIVDDAASSKKPSSDVVRTQGWPGYVGSRAWEVIKGPLTSGFLTGNFRSPKQMMEFLVKNGYATVKRSTPSQIGGIDIPTIHLTAGGENFITNRIYKYILWPAALAFGYTLLVEGAESFANVEANETDLLATFGASFIDFAQDEDNNETKKFIKGKEIEKILGENMVKALKFMNYYGIDESRQSDVYKWYKESILRDELSPIGRLGAGIVGLYSQSKRSDEQAKADNAKAKAQGEKDLEKAKEEVKTKGDAVARKEFNEANAVSYRMLSAGEKIAYLDKLGYSELKKRLDEGSYGDGLSYEDCQFVENAIHSYAKLTNDIPINTVMDGIYVTLVLKVGGKKYKLVPVLRDNDPEGIYGKYPNLDNKFAWIKPDVESNLSSKTYHGLKEFVDEFK